LGAGRFLGLEPGVLAMKQNFEIELDDYFGDEDDIDYENHFKNHRRRRSHDARRQIERLMEQRNLEKLLDPFADLNGDR
jgi:hypothetical protein